MVVCCVQVVLKLKAKRSRVGLSRLEVYLMDDPNTWTQTSYLTASGAAVLTSTDTSSHSVDEVSFQGF
jgi:hypothetical protein